MTSAGADQWGSHGVPIALIGGLTISLLDIATLVAGRSSCPSEKLSPIFSTRRRLFAVAVGAISYSGPILIDVR
jgi:hypothetical protein